MQPNGGLKQHFVRPLEQLRTDQQRLLQIARRALAAVPEARLAADQAYRLADVAIDHSQDRSEEHTSELQSLMRISYAVFCLKKKQTTNTQNSRTIQI